MRTHAHVRMIHMCTHAHMYGTHVHTCAHMHTYVLYTCAHMHTYVLYTCAHIRMIHMCTHAHIRTSFPHTHTIHCARIPLFRADKVGHIFPGPRLEGPSHCPVHHVQCLVQEELDRRLPQQLSIQQALPARIPKHRFIHTNHARCYTLEAERNYCNWYKIYNRIYRCKRHFA